MRLDEQKVQIMREKKVDTKVRVSQSVQAKNFKKVGCTLNLYKYDELTSKKTDFVKQILTLYFANQNSFM